MSRAPIDQALAAEALAAVARLAGPVHTAHLSTETGWDHDGYVIVWFEAPEGWADDVDWPDGVTYESINDTAVALLSVPFEEGCPDCGQDTLADRRIDEDAHPTDDLVTVCTDPTCGWVSE